MSARHGHRLEPQALLRVDVSNGEITTWKKLLGVFLRFVRHRLEGRCEHLLHELVAVGLAANTDHVQLSALRPLGHFGCAAAAELQLARSVDYPLRALCSCVEEGQRLGPHPGEHVEDVLRFRADAA